MILCGCEECQLLYAAMQVRSNLSYARWLGGDGPCVYYRYSDDDDLELAYQEGLLRGYEFRHAEVRSR